LRKQSKDIFCRLRQLPELGKFRHGKAGTQVRKAYSCPIKVVCGDRFGLGEFEDALLKDKLGFRGTHVQNNRAASTERGEELTS
jgi:hypothetical protein